MKKKLMRNTEKGIIAGVCAGFGDYFHISPWIFRIAFIIPVLPFILTGVATIVSIGVYILCVIFIPNKKQIEEGDVVEVDYEIVEDDQEDDDDVIDYRDDSKENGEV
jgi:phage shock protein PspC (stress-responsive transcriptional regulator)